MEKYWKIKNEELGYIDSETFSSFEEAYIASGGKCRRYGVIEYDAKTDEVLRRYSSYDLLMIRLDQLDKGLES